MDSQYQPNILTTFQEKTLKELFEGYEEIKDFYLTGGTALAAFYLHHRYSDDLDFFTQHEFNTFKLEQVLKDLVKKYNWQIISSRKETLFYEVFIQEAHDKTPLKIDFVKDVSAHFGKMEYWENTTIDSLRNIASNKVTALFGRTEPKNFIDFYFLLQKGISVWKIFEDDSANFIRRIKKVFFRSF